MMIQQLIVLSSAYASSLALLTLQARGNDGIPWGIENGTHLLRYPVGVLDNDNTPVYYGLDIHEGVTWRRSALSFCRELKFQKGTCEGLILQLKAKLPPAIERDRARRVGVLSRLQPHEREYAHALTMAIRSELRLTTSLLIDKVRQEGHAAASRVLYTVMDRLHNWDGNGGKHHPSQAANTDTKPEMSEGYIAPEQASTLASLAKATLQHHARPLWCEIGFNAGHSAAVVLSSHRYMHVLSFDIAEHGYCDYAERVVARMYPGRFRLVRGPSATTMPAISDGMSDGMVDRLADGMSDGDKPCDVVFIDGDHTFEAHP